MNKSKGKRRARRNKHQVNRASSDLTTPKPNPTQLLQKSRDNLKADVGVVLVHGIGNQVHGDVIQSFGRSCLDALALTSYWRGLTANETKHVSFSPTGPPESVLLTLTRDEETYSVRFSEAIWSDSFTRPSWIRIIFWFFRNFPASLLLLSPDQRDSAFVSPKDPLQRPVVKQETGFLKNLRRRIPDSDPDLSQGIPMLVRLLIRILIALILLTALATFLGLAWFVAIFVGILVITYLRSSKNIVGHVVIAASLAHELESMSSRVNTCIEWAEDRAESVIILAHSQGGYLSHRILSRRQNAGRVTELLGIGSALKPIWLLQHLQKSRLTLAMWLSLSGVVLAEFLMWNFLERNLADNLRSTIWGLGQIGVQLALPIGAVREPLNLQALLERQQEVLLSNSIDYAGLLTLGWRTTVAAIVAFLLIAIANRIWKQAMNERLTVASLPSITWTEYSSAHDLVGRMLSPALPGARELATSSGGHPIIDHTSYFSAQSLLPFHVAASVHTQLGLGRPIMAVQLADASLILQAKRRQALRLICLGVVMGFVALAAVAEDVAFGAAFADSSIGLGAFILLTGWGSAAVGGLQCRKEVERLRRRFRMVGSKMSGEASSRHMPTLWSRRAVPSLIAGMAGVATMTSAVLSIYVLPERGNSMLLLFNLGCVFAFYSIVLAAGYIPWRSIFVMLWVLLSIGHVMYAPAVPHSADIHSFYATPGNGAILLDAFFAIALLFFMRPIFLRRDLPRATGASY